MLLLAIFVALLLVWCFSVPGFEDYRTLLEIFLGITLFLHLALRGRVRSR
jgi:hypothetical protein